MQACCSFKSIVGGICGFDLRDRKQSTEIIPLHNCVKDISKHKTTYQFSGIENEVDLILCRAGLFSETGRRSQSMSVCPRHRSTLGLGWSRGASTRCTVPESISKHGEWPKGERGLGKLESEVVFRQTGLLVPVGSGKSPTLYENKVRTAYMYLSKQTAWPPWLTVHKNHDVNSIKI